MDRRRPAGVTLRWPTHAAITTAAVAAMRLWNEQPFSGSPCDDRRNRCISHASHAVQVDRAKVNEQFFSEIRNPQLSVFDVIGRYLDNHGALI